MTQILDGNDLNFYISDRKVYSRPPSRYETINCPKCDQSTVSFKTKCMPCPNNQGVSVDPSGKYVACKTDRRWSNGRHINGKRLRGTKRNLE